MILNLYKKEGETPLMCLRRRARNNPSLAGTKMTYAGRLDPMAEGVLLALTGEDVYRKDDFLKLEKEYIFEVIWGLRSDSHDILGIIEKGATGHKAKIEGAISEIEGAHELPYPAFSSRKLEGKPLFHWFRSGLWGKVNVPIRKMIVYRHEILETAEVSGAHILEKAIERIQKVPGDFRQELVVRSWQEAVAETSYIMTKHKVTAGSGTYIRSLVEEMGKKAGTGALAWSITRTAVGEYRIENAIR